MDSSEVVTNRSYNRPDVIVQPVRIRDYPDIHLATFTLNSFEWNYVNDTNDSYRFPIAVAKLFVMTTLIVTTLFGNGLVILSVYRSHRLRIIANSFIVSLAVADFMMAVLVMPFSASQDITGHWYFGAVVCDVFNANDVLFSTASLLHLCCIAVDRYVAIVSPFRYPSFMTRRTAAAMLSVVWTASALLSHVPIHLGWYTTVEHQHRYAVDDDSCSFEVNRIYGIISCSLSFWTPAIVIVIAYLKIYREAKKQEDMIYSLTYSVGRCVIGIDPVKYIAVRNRESLPDRNVRAEPSQGKMRSEHKAAKTLGVILGAFLACWLPFFTWYLTTSLCGETCTTPQNLVSALFWIGYSNSALNPIIYAFLNKDFRKAFIQILHCVRIRRNSAINSRSVKI